MSERITAPFTAEQVRALNAYQKALYVHPFTCGNDSRHHDLKATRGGWVCLDCDYGQAWAHGFMAGQAPDPDTEVDHGNQERA